MNLPTPAPGSLLLKDKVTVITGCASGIGRATALLFAQHGATVIGIDIADEAGREVIDAIRATGAQAHYQHADVTRSESVRAAVAECETRVTQVDVLFNNAGRVLRKRFEETDEAGWQAMLADNLTSNFLCAKHFLPLMKKAGGGSIINHASVDSSLGNPTIAAYSAAKGGLLPLTHVMAHDLAKYGIRVNAMSTGNITTALSGPGQGGAISARTAVTPLARTGRPEEAAHVALFFASDWSSFVNGANLVVDGGRTGITQGCFDR